MLDEVSIIKYGLSSINNIDLTKSFEIYDIHTNNHIINLFLIKDDKTYCFEFPHFLFRAILAYFLVKLNTTISYAHNCPQIASSFLRFWI